MNSHAFFTKTKIGKLFMLAAFPGAVGMLASSIYQLFDGMFVGHFVGETAFAALNLAMPFVIINFALADLIGVGSSVPISISLGQKKDKEAGNIFTCAVIMIIAAAIATGLLFYIFAPAMIGFMGAEGDFAIQAVQYLRVYAICSPFTTIVFAADNYLRICGRIRTSMVLNIIMSVFSVAIEFLFLGVFKWGVWAAALATCLGMGLCAVIAMFLFARGKLVLRFCKPKFTKQMVLQIISCGSPNFLSNIAGRITSILLNLILVRLGGETAVSVYGILMYAEGFVQPLLYGMCDSLQPAVGYNWGAGLRSRVRAIEKYCFSASAVISAVAVVALYLFPQAMTGLFMKDPTPDALAMSVEALKIFSISFIVRWISFATQSFMLAIEKAASAALISVSIALIFPVILVVILWPLGLTGIWLNFVLTNVLAMLLAFLVLWKERREIFKKDVPFIEA